MSKNKSVLEMILFGEDKSVDDLRNKNIRQTELLVDLREAILQVGRHFQVSDFDVIHHGGNFLCNKWTVIIMHRQKFNIHCQVSILFNKTIYNLRPNLTHFFWFHFQYTLMRKVC